VTPLVITDAVVIALSMAVRVVAIRHYWSNWRSRRRRNPESAAIVLEIGMNMFGAVMGLSDAHRTGGHTALMVGVTMAIQLAIGVNLVWAISMARRMYAAQEDRRDEGNDR
jgi:hypothetical protein